MGVETLYGSEMCRIFGGRSHEEEVAVQKSDDRKMRTSTERWPMGEVIELAVRPTEEVGGEMTDN